jgi:hypothetical protein
VAIRLARRHGPPSESSEPCKISFPESAPWSCSSDVSHQGVYTTSLYCSSKNRAKKNNTRIFYSQFKPATGQNLISKQHLVCIDSLQGFGNSEKMLRGYQKCICMMCNTIGNNLWRLCSSLTIEPLSEFIALRTHPIQAVMAAADAFYILYRSQIRLVSPNFWL